MKLWFFKPIVLVALIILSGCDANKTVGVQEQLDALNTLLVEAYQNRDYAEALFLAQEGAILSRREFGQKHPQSLSNLTRLALIYVLLGQFEAAEPFYQIELNINRRVFGENHPKTLISLNNLGLIYVSLRGFEKAEPLLEEALRINRKANIHRITTLNNLAYLYRLQSRFSDAEQLYEKARNIRREGFEPGDPDRFEGADQITWVVSFMGEGAGNLAVDCSIFNGGTGPFNPDPETGGMMAQCGPFGTRPTYGMWGGWNGADIGGCDGCGGGDGIPPIPPGGGGGDDPGLPDEEKERLPRGIEEDFNGCSSNEPGSGRDECCSSVTVGCISLCPPYPPGGYIMCSWACEDSEDICKSGNRL